MPAANQPPATSQADALLAQFMSAEDDGSLAQRVREVVAGNRRKATKPARPPPDMAPARASGPRRSQHKPVFYLLAGPNGAGKTTLYRALVLAGVIPAVALCKKDRTQKLVQPLPAWAQRILWGH